MQQSTHQKAIAHQIAKLKHWWRTRRIRKIWKISKEIIVLGFALCILITGGLLIWVATFKLPDLGAIAQVQAVESTKIYDRTGKILLYDVHHDIKRTSIPFDQISKNIKDATVSIEDPNFYQNIGIEPKAILRAIYSNLLHLRFSQGGSTITQQVIKNSFLTADKTISRKLKEWVLAIKLTQVLDKNSILGIYLNEAPYGGNIYGIEEASQEYFSKHASDLTIAEAAYLAAIPQAPTYYSPFGSHKDALNARKNSVLKKMLDNRFITNDQYLQARQEQVVFNSVDEKGIKAPHFVFYIRDYLVQKYGEEAVQKNGYKVITTLNYDLQQKAEAIVKQYALQNKKTYDAENAALVAIDPHTGQILTMVGSRDYFDTEINGNFNVALAHRQPGSSFKPFVYATAFEKGYTPDTVLFDLKTEFAADCTPQSTPKYPGAQCYSPVDYDGKFRGPMTLRDALAQSINIPAIKLLYLTGEAPSLKTAKDMGITSLGDANQYGLTLVLGGGEVSLLDMTSAYSVFANDGIRNPETGILQIQDKDGNVIEQFQDQSQAVMDPNITHMISDVLSDNVARTPDYGPNSPLYFPGKDVAVKTGTTNDFRDVWVIGYSPNIAVGTWGGNNDNRPILKDKTAGFVLAPMWNAFMQVALQSVPDAKFQKPIYPDETKMKPVFNGFWQGGQPYFVDKVTGKLATQYTPPDQIQEKVVPSVHSILYWVNKDDPLGAPPSNPASDPQFANWEYPVRLWAQTNGLNDQTTSVIPTQSDDVHNPSSAPKISIHSPLEGASYSENDTISITLTTSAQYPITKAEYYLNNSYLGSTDQSPFIFSFIPNGTDGVQSQNEVRVVVTDSVGNKAQANVHFTLTDFVAPTAPAPQNTATTSSSSATST
jgi:1A family penicillin-binding protein